MTPADIKASRIARIQIAAEAFEKVIEAHTVEGFLTASTTFTGDGSPKDAITAVLTRAIDNVKDS